MRTRPTDTPPPPPPPERRGAGRSRGSHARAPERGPAKAAARTVPRRPGDRLGGFGPGLGGGPGPGSGLGAAAGTGPGSGPGSGAGRRPGLGRAGGGRGRTGIRPASGEPWQRAKVWRGPRTVRAKVVALLMVPIISLMTLWGLAAVSTAQNMWSLQQLRSVNTNVRQPIESMINALQQERSSAMTLLAITGNGSGLGTDQIGYQSDFAATDSAQTQVQSGSQRAAAALNNLGSDTRQRISTLLGSLGTLASLRHQVASSSISVSTAYSDYCATIDQGFAVEGSLATLQDDAVGSNAQSVLQLAQAGEMLARQDSVLHAAFSAGRVSPADYQEFVGAAYAQNLLQIDSARALSPTDQAAYQRVVGSPQDLVLRRDQTDVLAAGPGPTSAVGFSPTDWVKPESVTLTGLNAVATAAGTAAVARIDPYAGFLGTPQGIAVLVGLIAVLLSLLVSVRIGRGLVLELVGLRDTALDLARRRLPRAIARLRAGQSVDVDTEAPPAMWVDDEIGQVGEALAAAARAAIQAAVERAEVVSAVAGVFLNLARRSQLLVHRQLALLDTMERRNEDPDELEDLFRLDHLATRMRRHAEGLIILSGATPGRGWRKPVPLMDVLRAAVAEVEDYARVDVRRLELVHLAGVAVADLTHLIAELVENATVFSPPHTRVQVRGEQVGSGFAIDIEDRGLGMGEQAIAEANQRIANTDQADLFDSDRLGLFVVSRLARRHNIQVTLGRSAYGGTTAVVLLPKALLENTAAGSFSQAEAGHKQDSAGAKPGWPEFAWPGADADAETNAGARAGAGAGTTGPGAEAGKGANTGVGVRAEAEADADAASVAGTSTGTSTGIGRANSEPILIGAPGATGEHKTNGATHTHLNGFYRQLSDLEPDRPSVPTQSLPRFEPSSPGSAVPDPAARHEPAATSDLPGRTTRTERRAQSPRPESAPESSESPESVSEEAPEAGSGAHQRVRPEPSAPTAPLPPTGTGTHSPEQLPRRVRQANLAPQLREPGDTGEFPSPAQAAPTTPERARATMAAFQKGWTLGRTEHTAQPSAGPDPGSAAAAAGTAAEPRPGPAPSAGEPAGPPPQGP